MFAKRSLYLSAAALVLTLSLSGCAAGWTSAGVTPQAFFQQSHPTRVRVITTANDTLVMASTVISDDSLIGLVENFAGPVENPIGRQAKQAQADGHYLWISLRDIQEVATEKENGGAHVLDSLLGAADAVMNVLLPPEEECEEDDAYCIATRGNKKH